MENLIKPAAKLVLVFLVAMLCIVAIMRNTPSASAQPSSIAVQSTAASSTFLGGFATTTLSYMSAGNATSTYQIDSAGAYSILKPNVTMQSVDGGSLLIEFVASTSASILNYQFQYSNNNLDWYPETQQQTLGSSGNATSSPVTHSFSSNAIGTTTMIAALPNLPAWHERVVFTVPIGSANGAVYSEVVTKRNPSSP